MAGVAVGAVFGVGCLILAVVWYWTTSRWPRSSKNKATMGAETTNHSIHKPRVQAQLQELPGQKRPQVLQAENLDSELPP